MSDADKRIIELAEDRLRVAEELNLSVSGLVGLVHACVEAGELGEACEHLEKIDELINRARDAADGSRLKG